MRRKWCLRALWILGPLTADEMPLLNFMAIFRSRKGYPYRSRRQPLERTFPARQVVSDGRKTTGVSARVELKWQ